MKKCRKTLGCIAINKYNILFSKEWKYRTVLVNKARPNLDNTQSLLIASAIMQSGTVISDHIIPQGHAA
jgi:hypothetical protein